MLSRFSLDYLQGFFALTLNALYNSVNLHRMARTEGAKYRIIVYSQLTTGLHKHNNIYDAQRAAFSLCKPKHQVSYCIDTTQYDTKN